MAISSDDRDTVESSDDRDSVESSGTSPRNPDGMGRRRRWALAVAVGSALLALGGLGASLVIKSPAQVAAEAEAPAQDVLTAEVEHRVLVSSIITRGEVVAGQTVRVAPQISDGEGGSGAVITKIAATAGSGVRNGQVLLEISGRPVFALRGKLPVYRDLRPGATGKDVTQLQRALRGLGHGTGSDPDGTFGAGTKAALTAFYAAIGYDPRPAQDDDGAALDAAAEAVTGAERAVEDAEDSRDAADSDPDGALGKAVDRAKEDLTKARTAYAEAQAESGPMLPAGEAVFLESFPARVGGVQGRVGDQVSGTVMTVSAGRLLAEAYVPEYQKGLLRAGRRVEIHSEVSGVTAEGEVTSVAETMSTADETSGDTSAAGGDGDAAGGAAGYLVRITPDKALDPQLTGQDVRLTIEAASTGGKALVVPVTAITSGADGRTVVTVVAVGGAQRRVEVRPGTSGDGYVAVEPVDKRSLKAGDKVVTGVDEDTAATGGASR
ncbi:peptidoglycan-binding protein [Streptomyces sp. NPDC048420]|uniref:peptidoglycan-binding protein n=1 Tax=Streptomyces sp. NPDC048420 TaxID=3155755 RepID=UPI003435B58F